MKYQIAERGARMARRDEREYREYLREGNAASRDAPPARWSLISVNRPLGADVGCRRRAEPPGQPAATVIGRIRGRGLREVNLHHHVPRRLRFQPQVAAAGGDEVEKDAEVDSGFVEGS